jgi:hypothetical protein
MPQATYGPPFLPYDAPPIPITSARATARTTEIALPAGQLRLVSQLTVSDGSDSDSASVHHNALGGALLPTNIRSLQRVDFTLTPATIRHQGIVTDEIGSSALELRWRVYPECQVQIAGAWTRIANPTPAFWKAHLDTTGDDHAWGPVTISVLPRPSATFSPNLAIPANSCAAVAVGVSARHWLASSDVSLVSGLDVDFVLTRIDIVYT